MRCSFTQFFLSFRNSEYVDCPRKICLGPCNDENLMLINSLSISKCSLMRNLNIDTLFVDINALRVEMSMMKVQICCHRLDQSFGVFE